MLRDGTNTYVYGLDLISATDGAGAQTYFTYDGLGSTTDLTNAAGVVTDTYSYDVFGAVRSHTGSSANYWQFTGEQRDVTETFGSFIFAKTELSPELQSHELCHIPQWEFYAGEFLLQYLVTPGMFEEEADLCARQ